MIFLTAKPDTFTLASKDIERLGPKPAPLDPMAQLGYCPACRQPFAPGDFTGFVGIGPGPDPEARENCRAGREFHGVSIEVHWACLTGREE